jgi:hypothetical protein
MATMPYRRLACVPLLALLAAAGSCSHDEPTAVVDAFDGQIVDDALASPASLLTGGYPREFTVPTYERSGQSVHPDVVLFPERWHQARLWLSLTPYPGSDSKFENPSILQNRVGGFTFAPPPGVVNPLVPAIPDSGYNSDPDLVHDVAVDRLVMTYRAVLGGKNSIRMIESGDGRDWSEPVVAVEEPNHGAVSPTVVPGAGMNPAMMWYVDAGTAGCRTNSSTVVARRAVGGGRSLTSAAWEAPIVTDLRQSGYVIWHIKVRYVEALRLYLALYVAFPADGRACGSDDMFLATSADGVHWRTFVGPFMRHEALPWTAGALYRGTFVYHANRDVLSIWFSAYGSDSRWRLGFVDYRLGPLLADLGAGRAASAAAAGDRERRAASRPVWTDAP